MWKNPLMLVIFIRPEVAINEYPSSFYVYFVNCAFFPLWMPPPFCNTSAWLRINASLFHSTCLVLVMAPSFVPVRLLCLILCIALSCLCICCTFARLQFILLTCFDCSARSDCSLWCVYGLAVLMKCCEGCSPAATVKLKLEGVMGPVIASFSASHTEEKFATESAATPAMIIKQ